MIELIDKYVNGELTEDELIAFEARMREDSHFAEEVKAQVKAEYAIRIEARAAQKAALKADYALLVSKGAIRPVMPFYQRFGFWLVSAAAVLLLLLIALS